MTIEQLNVVDFTSIDKAGRKIVINIFGKFPLSEQATRFLQLASEASERAGFRLRFELKQPN